MPQNFFGRETELAKIQKQWEAIVSGKTEASNILVITGSTGEGKTRLVQRFYETLANDAAWNPTEKAYWPSVFQKDEPYLRVKPDMEDYQPAGPPRFIWLGMRWQNRELRNLEERRCPIPEVRKELRLHNDQIKKHKTIWEKLWGVAKPEMFGGVKESALEKIIEYLPINGFALKVIGSFGKIVHETNQLNKSLKEKTEEINAGDIEALIDDLEIYFSSKVALPLILFLDDAQWIDESTLKFIDIFAKEVRNKKLPVFMVITHWVAEWNELKERPESLNLRSICDFSQAEVMDLSVVDATVMRNFMLSKLPGLNYKQQKILIEKSCNNFLSLEENIGYLLDTPENFVDENVAKSLSEIGENEITTWESDRSKRIKLQFNKLEKDAKRVLGWSSQIGVRFLADVIEKVAEQEALTSNLKVTFRKVEQRAYISPVNTYFKEFRDRAIFKCAQNYFKTYDTKMESSILNAIKSNSILLIHNAFNEVGSVKTEFEKMMQHEVGIIDFEPTERRDILGMMLQAVGFPDREKHNKDEYTLSTRILVLDFLNDYNSDLLGAAKKKGERLKDVQWDYLVPDGVGWDQRLELCDLLNKIECYSITGPILESLKKDPDFYRELFDESLRVRVKMTDVEMEFLEETGCNSQALSLNLKALDYLENHKGFNLDSDIMEAFAQFAIRLSSKANSEGQKIDINKKISVAAEFFYSNYKKFNSDKGQALNYLNMAIWCWRRNFKLEMEEAVPYVKSSSFVSALKGARFICEAMNGAKAACLLLDVLKDGCEVFAAFNKERLSKKCFKKMKIAYQQKKQLLPIELARKYKAKLQNTEAFINYHFGNNEKAKRSFNQTYKNAKSKFVEDNSIKNLEFLASAAFEVGNNYYLGDDFVKALPFLYEAYECNVALFHRRKNIDEYEQICRVAKAICDCESNHQSEKFKNILNDSIPIFESVYQEIKNNYRNRSLAMMLNSLGVKLINSGQYDKAKRILHLAMSINDCIENYYNMPDLLKNSVVINGQIGIADIYLGFVDEGENKLKTMVGFYEQKKAFSLNLESNPFIRIKNILEDYINAFESCGVNSRSYFARKKYLEFWEREYQIDSNPEYLECLIACKIHLTKAFLPNDFSVANLLKDAANDIEEFGQKFPDFDLFELRQLLAKAEEGWADN